jgi:predicted dehydrogenase
MTAKARVGLVGCGIIGRHYAERAAGFDSFEIVACADVDTESAEALAAEQGIEAATVDEIVAAPDVDIVLNLTPPSAHAPVIRAALAAGKHVYTEKPLASSFAEAATLVAEADRLGLRLGCAPDTFLGAAYQAAHALVADGTIGEPISATASILVGGPESWHPNADFFFRAGAGPMLDMAPYYLTAIASLLGPFAAATGFTATPTPERTLRVGPRAGERFRSDVPTHAAAALKLESGAVATLVASFEARDQYVSELVLHGTEGMLVLPDANAFGGDVRVRRARGDWRDVVYDAPAARETRGLGLDEMLVAIRAGRPHRASGSLALHVLETAEAVLAAAADGRTVELSTRPGERMAA